MKMTLKPLDFSSRQLPTGRLLQLYSKHMQYTEYLGPCGTVRVFLGEDRSGKSYPALGSEAGELSLTLVGWVTC